MSKIHGKNGTVTLGGNAVANVTDFEVDQQIGTVDTTSMGDTDESHVTGFKSWSASLTCYLEDSNDSGQAAGAVGSSVTADLAPDGSDNITGTATVTGRRVVSNYNGIVTLALTLKGNGSVTDNTNAS